MAEYTIERIEHNNAVFRETENEYAAVRANPRHYFTAPGHEEAEKPVGQVVSREDGYVVVEKP